MSQELVKQFETCAESLLKTLGYSKEVQKHLESVLNGIEKRDKLFDKANHIYEKALISEKKLYDIERNLEKQKEEIENDIIDINRQVVRDDSIKRPTIQDARESLDDFKEKLIEKKRKLASLVKEKNNRDHEEHKIKLLKKMLPVHFEVNPDDADNQIHGFVKREDSKVELFDFDMDKCDRVEVADFFWGHNKH